MNQNELTHYGVLGMKWGVRRAQTQADRVAKRVEKLKAKKKEHDKLIRAKNKLSKLQEEEASLKEALKNKPKKVNEEKATKPEKHKKKKKISEMTDEELNAVINRKNLEKRYLELVSPSSPKEEKKKIFDGRQFISKLTQQTAEDLGVQVTKHLGAKLINNILNETITVEKTEKDDNGIDRKIKKKQRIDVVFANNKKKS